MLPNTILNEIIDVGPKDVIDVGHNVLLDDVTGQQAAKQVEEAEFDSQSKCSTIFWVKLPDHSLVY